MNKFITEEDLLSMPGAYPIFQRGICFSAEVEDKRNIYKVIEGTLRFPYKYAVQMKTKLTVQLMKFEYDKTELIPIDGLKDKQYMTYKVYNLVEDTKAIPFVWKKDIFIDQLLRQDKINMMKRIYKTKRIKLHDTKPDDCLYYDYDDLENILLYNQKIALVYDKRRN